MARQLELRLHRQTTLVQLPQRTKTVTEIPLELLPALRTTLAPRLPLIVTAMVILQELLSQVRTTSVTLILIIMILMDVLLVHQEVTQIIMERPPLPIEIREEILGDPPHRPQITSEPRIPSITATIQMMTSGLGNRLLTKNHFRWTIPVMSIGISFSVHVRG